MGTRKPVCEECSEAIVDHARRGRCKPCYRRYIRRLKKSGEYSPLPTATARPRTLEQRITGLRQTSETAGACWLWDGEMKGNGYGRVSVKGKNRLAHRAVYEHLRGPIPDGLVLDHLCRNRACVNPDHLEPVTNAINIMRGVGVGAVNAAKTHCVHGHEFTPENTRFNKPFRPTGVVSRACRQCHRERTRAYRRSSKSSQQGAAP